jgi:hypothetical protein
MINYVWEIQSMATLPNVPNQPEYVVLINGELIGTDDNSITASIGWNVQLVVEQNQPDFIPYDQLTEAEVLGWVQEALGPQGVGSLEANIQGQINSIINPPVSPSAQPLPWSNK